MKKILFVLPICLCFLVFNLLALEIKNVVEGSFFSGAYAGVNCFEAGLCLAGFRTDIDYGGAKIKKSTDYGKTWSDFKNISGAQSARAYYFAKSEKTILASGGAAGAEDGAHPNIFISLDAGDTWEVIATSEMIKALPNCMRATGVYNILYLGNSSFIAGLEGVPVIIRSDDLGKTWKYDQTLGSKSRSIRRMYNLSDGSIAALAYGDGLYLSYDNGISWKKMENSPSDIFSLTDFGNGVYLAGTTGQTGSFLSKGQGIYRSLDFGKTWKKVAKVKTNSDITYVRTIIKVHSNLAYAFAAGNEYAQHDRALSTFISTNNGESWKLTPNFLKSKFGELNAIYDAANPEANVFLFGGQPDGNIFWVQF